MTKKPEELTLNQYELNAAETASTEEKWDQINRVFTPEFTGLLRRFVTVGRAIENYKKAAFHGKNLETFPEVITPAFALEGNYNYQLLHGVVGTAGEAAEVVEVLLDAIEKGEPVDKDLMTKEAGDVLWYLARLANGADTPLEQIANENTDKLRARHAEKLAAKT